MYSFYVAQIIEASTVDDNRLRVRVLPYMEGIPKEKCPCWPSFFRDELYTGKEGDYVWVICNDEFSLGYIFGLANYNTYGDVTTESGTSIFKTSRDGISLSIPEELRNTIMESSCKTLGTSLNLTDAKVTFWSDNCVHYVERSTGGFIIAFSNGTLYIFRPKEIILKIGNSESAFRMDADTLSAVADTVKLQGEVNLGKNPSANVLVSGAGSGVSSLKSSSVKA
jgi:hypothetical protein